MDFFDAFMGRSGFLPHGYCITWNPALLWSMVGADTTIALSYFSIPIAIVSFVRRRPGPPGNWVAWLFSAFIFACGTTHLMDVWTLWQPDYGLQALTKVVTAAVSLVTAVALWKLMPLALALPTLPRLRSVIDSLTLEVHKRRTAEESLLDSQENLAVVLASIGAGFIATDRDGRVSRMNAVAEKVTGWAEGEARGRNIRDVFTADESPAILASINPVDYMIRHEVAIDTAFDFAAISRDNVRTPLEVKAALTHTHDGTVRGMAMIFRDMTLVNQAGIELNRLAAIVASSNDAIIGKTLDGRITSWNRAAETMFGYSADEAIGQPIQMLIPADLVQQEMRLLADLARGEVVPAFDTRRRTKDGRVLDVSLAVSPIRDASGRIVGASKIVRDVSPQLQAELAVQRLEAENRQIQEANRLKSQLLANMSHELRTPLNAIIGFADLLHSGAVRPESPKHHTFLGHIGTSGRHLLQLINDVLDLSKVESGKFEFVPEPTRLPLIVKEVQDILHTSTLRKRIAMLTDIDPGVADLVLDPARLKQVLYNYLSNAIKFTADGGCVTVRARAEGRDRVRIEVQDTGIGIAEADMSRLFVEFQQLDAGLSKAHQGTGLGLALTRRLVEAQGGTVGVRSAPGVGSVFHLVLDRRHGAKHSARATPTADTHHRRLLMIQEDRGERAGVVEALAEAGFDVDIARTGQQAIEHARAEAYDAITLDLTLPDQSGLGVLANIREGGPSRASPVLGVSMPTDGAKAVAFSIADVLSKPIRTEEIVAAMTPFALPQPGRANVMVIDDDPLALELMRASLTDIGVKCIGLLDGRRALREIEQHRPDAIVLDLIMPGFDGFEVLDALQRMPAWKDTPVFIWTSMILAEDEYASLARSARIILSKGGGELTKLLDGLRRWRPALATAAEGNPP